MKSQLKPFFLALSFFLFFLLTIPILQTALAETPDLKNELKPRIQKLFPKATRIEDKQLELPVFAVYQLDRLLGYAWLSTDINNIPGFSGSPISLLIGLSKDGFFQNVLVLDHNEPVFMHGLGNEALYDFVTQYAGHSVRDQIIISNDKKGQSSNLEDGPVYFDGVTKATISVEIINDVALSTALKVARLKLAEFALPAESVLTDKKFEPLSWNELLASDLVHHWQVDTNAVLAELGRDLEDYPDILQSQQNDNPLFSDIYFAYINSVDVGQNLLGERVYRTLKNNLKAEEHLVWIASNGIYPHISEQFKRGTVPARISIQQGGLSIEIRDIDVASDIKKPFITGAPDFSEINIFRIKGASGYDIGSEITLNLSILLARNHLITDSLVLHQKYQLPSSQWIRIESPVSTAKPLWLKLWLKKSLPLVIFLLSLVILIWAFIKQHQFSKHAAAFNRFRWIYLWFTLLFTGFYLQGQLSIVNIFTLFQSLRDGFNLSIFLLDPVIFILWLVTFVSLFIWGRGLFCGWLCPFGALQEILSALAKKLKLKQIRIPAELHRKLITIKYPILIGLVGLSFYSLTWSEKLAEIEPFKTSITLVFVREWPFVLYAVVLLLTGLFIHKFYCRYVCPLGAGLAIIGMLRRFEWLERIPLCGKPCQTCHHRCQIDAIKKDGDIDYNECIQCLECVVILNSQDQCTEKLLKQKNKPIPIQTSGFVQ